VADDLPVTMLIGLCADPNTVWADLRVGELKTMAALHAESTDDILDSCAWIAQFNELAPARAALYRCISNLVQINDELAAGTTAYTANLSLMYGAETLHLAQQLVAGSLQYNGLNNLGNNMQGSDMHQKLLAAYGKVWKF
jgi:ribosomal protein S12 methylthiotransferase accessory factor